MLAHDPFARASAPGFAPSSPKNRSWRSVPIARGSTKRQYTDRPAQRTNPKVIANRRRFQPSPFSAVRPVYAAASRRTPGMSRTKASQARRPALRGPRGPITLRTTAKIQRRFVAKRRADAAVSRAAESPSHRSGRSPFANPSFTSWGLGTRGRLVKGFCALIASSPLVRRGCAPLRSRSRPGAQGLSRYASSRGRLAISFHPDIRRKSLPRRLTDGPDCQWVVFLRDGRYTSILLGSSNVSSVLSSKRTWRKDGSLRCFTSAAPPKPNMGFDELGSSSTLIPAFVASSQPRYDALDPVSMRKL